MNQSSVDGISSMTRHSVWPLLSTIPVIQMEPKPKPVYLSNHSSVQEDKHEAMEIVVDEMKEEEEEALLQSQVWHGDIAGMEIITCTDLIQGEGLQETTSDGLAS